MGATLSNFVLDLYADFGPVQPRPQGPYFVFTFIVNKSTYEKVLATLTSIFRANGLQWATLVIQPGPEKKEPWNRLVKMAVDKDSLVPQRNFLR